jgi:capsular polysaccharide biosynthesis protein
MRNNIQNINNRQREPRVEQELELVYVFKVLRKRLWIILLITMLATFAAYFYHSNFHTPLYQSSTRMILRTENQEFIKTLQAIVKDPAILEKVINNLNANMTIEELSNRISVESVGSSQVVNLKVINSDPETAALIANTTATVFKQEVASILNFEGITVLSKAKRVPVPVNNNKTKTILAGFVVGILGSIGFVFLLNAIDNTLKTESEVEEFLGLPVLGCVSKINKRNTKKKIKKQKIAV